jgi:hypothetical protein
MAVLQGTFPEVPPFQGWIFGELPQIILPYYLLGTLPKGTPFKLKKCPFGGRPQLICIPSIVPFPSPLVGEDRGEGA